MSSAITGDYLSLAEACGEVEPQPLTFTPGEDFDPADPDDVAAVGLAMERDRADRENSELRKLRDENRELKIQLAMLENGIDYDEAVELIDEPMTYGFDDGFIDD